MRYEYSTPKVIPMYILFADKSALPSRGTTRPPGRPDAVIAGTATQNRCYAR